MSKKLESLEKRLALLESVLKQTVECLKMLEDAVRRDDVSWSLTKTNNELLKRVESLVIQ